MTEPAWLTEARKYVGVKDGDQFIAAAHCGEPHDPWCAIFANAMLEATGVAGTHSAAARSFESSPGFVKIAKPVVGAIATMWRGSPQAGTGHVTFVTEDQGNKFLGLGGNQSAGEVNIEAFAEGSGSRITGFWWPAKVPMAGGAAVIPPTPAGKIFSVTASQFGGPDDPQSPEDPEAVAYADVARGWADRIGFSLPFHFHGPRRLLRCTYKGKSIVGPIIDVGPHHTNDPYWEGSGHPQAEGESGNRSGLDMTPASAAALNFPGLGPVTWCFMDDTASLPPAPKDPSPATPTTPAPQIDWTPLLEALAPVLEQAAVKAAPIAGPYLERVFAGVACYLPELAILAGAPTGLVHFVGLLPPNIAVPIYIVSGALGALGLLNRYAPAGPAAPAHQYHGGPKGS